MSSAISLTIDGVEIGAEPGQSILQAAEAAGIYIPRLCHHKELVPYGSCRICTVYANGRPVASCTQPAVPGMIIDNSSEKVTRLRRDLLEMLLVEGNHFCMFCEKSGNCELQALAYRFGITAPKYPYLFPKRDVDASHPGVFIDRNRCVLCGRCVRASRDLDGKHVFDFVGRGPDRRIAVNAEFCLADTDLAATDRAAEVCPVGAILVKRVGYRVPVGQRQYDHQPIGSDLGAGGGSSEGQVP